MPRSLHRPQPRASLPRPNLSLAPSSPATFPQYYSNGHYAQVAGVSLRELNAMEVDLLHRLGFRCAGHAALRVALVVPCGAVGRGVVSSRMRKLDALE